MTLKQEQLERMNAYVDGELSARDRARVAREIASDPALARTVASMSAVKVGVKEAFATDDAWVDLDSAAGGRSLFARIAASVACVLMAGAVCWFLVFDSNGAPDGFADALQKYDEWQTSRREQPATAATVDNLIMPDLTPAGLTIASVEPAVRLGGLDASHVTYLGNRGCRLSFFAYDLSQGSLINVSKMLRPDVLTKGWSVANIGFLLVARKMDKDRFDVVAEAIQEATIKIAPLKNETRLAMRFARQPCTA